MPKILFHSYRGNPWEFDIVSRRIAPAEPSGPGKAHQATDGRFFGDMRGVSREEFDDQINNHAEILILNVTDRCNLRCKYCVFSGAYCGQRVHGSATMSLDTAMRGIDQFIARTGKTLQNPEKKLSIGFYGGEPLLAFDLIREVLDRVHGAEYSQLAGRLTHSITTNGTLLDEEKVEVLVKYGVSMQVSLDGPQELHDRNRVWPDGSGTFGAVVRNLEGACQRFPDFFASFAYVVTMFAPLRYLQRAAFFDSHPLFQGHQFRVTSVATANCDLAFDTSEEEKDRVEFAALLRQFHGRAVQRDTAAPPSSPGSSPRTSRDSARPKVRRARRPSAPMAVASPASGAFCCRRLAATTSATRSRKTSGCRWGT